MPTDVPGIHHVTAVGGDPVENLRFYTETLGLRLVKRSVNQDDVTVYHLFYGDRTGSPGTSMTFFPYPGAGTGRIGAGQVTTTQFGIPADAVGYWERRLTDAGLDVATDQRFGADVLGFSDPDGLSLELVASDEPPRVEPPDGPVPTEHAIRGFFGATLTLTSADPTARLVEAMGYERTRDGDRRTRYEAAGDVGAVLDVRERPQAKRGVPGSGTVHHVAFRAADDELEAWRELLRDRGLRPTEVIDRTWFRSVYVRTPGGVLFEFATQSPGYTVDEDVESLGERLMLPERLEPRREAIEAGLPDLQRDRSER